MASRWLSYYRNAYTGLSKEIWLLALVMLVNRSGTMVLAFMTLYCKSLGFSTAQAGWAVSTYGLGSIAGAYLGGRISDRFGFYPTQFSALLLGGLLFISLGQVTRYEFMLPLIFLLSMVNESFRPANATAITRYSTTEKRTQAFSLIRLAINLGWGIGSALGGILASFNYSLLFWTDGATNILGAICLLWLLPKPGAEKRGVADHKPKRQNTEKHPSPLQDKVFVIFLGLQVLFAFCFFQLFTMVPLFFKEGLQLSEFRIGVLMSVNGVLIALVEMVLVFMLEGKKPYLWLMALGSALMAFSYALFLLPAQAGAWIALLFILCITLGEMISMPFMNSFYISRSRDHNRGQYAGYYTMAWSVAQVLGSAAGAWMAGQWGFSGHWIIISLLSLAAMIGYFRLLRLTKLEKYKSD